MGQLAAINVEDLHTSLAAIYGASHSMQQHVQTWDAQTSECDGHIPCLLLHIALHANAQMQMEQGSP